MYSICKYVTCDCFRSVQTMLGHWARAGASSGQARGQHDGGGGRGAVHLRAVRGRRQPEMHRQGHREYDQLLSVGSLLAGCHVTFYCSRGCQKSHWKIHKSQCCAYKVRPRLVPSVSCRVGNEDPEKDSTRAFSCLKAITSAFTLKNSLWSLHRRPNFYLPWRELMLD